MSSPSVGPRPFLFLCRFTLAAVVLNVVTGAAVRLSDSGLGCPDWPNCSQHHLTPALRLHPLVEFGNRLVVFVLVVACLVTVVAAFFRRPARSDLRWLASGLILGVIGEAVLGAFVVYTKLNAYVVMTHFMVGMALLAVAVVLTLEADHRSGPGALAVTRGALWLTRTLVGLTVVVLAAGAATTGTGPHAGGKGAKRIPLGLEDMTRIHAEVVLAAGGALVGAAPRAVEDGRPGSHSERRPGPAGGDGGPGHDRLHPVLQPSPAGPGRDPRARSVDGVGRGAVVPSRAVGPPAGVDRRARARRGAGPGGIGGEGDVEGPTPAGAGMSMAAPSPVHARQTEVEPREAERTDVVESQHTDRPWLVIVWNDPINLMSFVTFVFQKLFGYSKEKATKLMLDVHHKGRAVVSSGTRERAELDVYRLHEHGLWATMEQST